MPEATVVQVLDWVRRPVQVAAVDDDGRWGGGAMVGGGATSEGGGGAVVQIRDLYLMFP